MKPVTIIIKGSFWDSQIYSGELMLLGPEGSIVRVQWADAIDDFSSKHTDLQTAIRVAFSDSDWLYNPQTKRLLDDPKISAEVKGQLSQLANLPKREIRQSDWQKFWITESSPFNILPTDTDVYKNKIYAASEEGLFSVPRNGVGLSQKVEKHHDASYLQVRASDGYKSVAAAAGRDGLFEFSIGTDEGDLERKVKILSKRTCTACDWAFQSVVGWNAEAAFFASFTETKETSSSKNHRSPSTVFDFSSLFENARATHDGAAQIANPHSFSWGSREKLYRATHEGIEVTDYFGHGWVKKPVKKIALDLVAKQPFIWRGLIPKSITQVEPANIVATGTAPFGAVIEEDDKLTVIASDGTSHVFEGELVHWRVFPRSSHYSNQLHLIYEDRLEIVSFVHDYFENQVEKLAGFVK